MRRTSPEEAVRGHRVRSRRIGHRHSRSRVSAMASPGDALAPVTCHGKARVRRDPFSFPVEVLSD